MKEVTVILTSSGRFDLLRITLESFVRNNTYDIKRFHVHDDSGLPIPDDLKESYPFIEWTRPAEKIIKNHIRSLDYLWLCCGTPYAFTMEDDWEFLRPGFIEASMEILESNEKIMMVWLKELEEHNTHPVEWPTSAFGIFKPMPNLWAWHRFNPSLKRKYDYDLIAPFSKHTTFNTERAWKAEADISQVYHKLGFTAAILPQPYIRHIGEGRHVG